MLRPTLAASLALFLAAAGFAAAQESPLTEMQTGDDSRGWEAVGRLNFGDRGFCTGAMIAPDLVLTAGHCLFDKETGARFQPEQIQFLAGWRNGRAIAYRGVKRAIAHPEFVYGGHDDLERVPYDLALVQLDQPIRLPAVAPYRTGPMPVDGEAVGVVSYAQDRSEAPSIQKVCHVLGQQDAALILTCDVDFGSSGSPIFEISGGMARIVSVISAKAEMDGRKVSLGTSLTGPLPELMDELHREEGSRPEAVTVLSGGAPGGAKFVKP